MWSQRELTSFGKFIDRGYTVTLDTIKEAILQKNYQLIEMVFHAAKEQKLKIDPKKMVHILSSQDDPKIGELVLTFCPEVRDSFSLSLFDSAIQKKNVWFASLQLEKRVKNQIRHFSI